MPSEGHAGGRAVALTRLVTGVVRADWRPEDTDVQLRALFHQRGDSGTLTLVADESPLVS